MNEKNCSRLQEFRQLQKEIRGSHDYLIVGIDVAKEKHTAFFGTATGRTLFRRLVFENNREGFERLLVQAEAMRVQHGLKKVVFGLEPTATYHKALGEYLIGCGHRVVLVSTKSVKSNRESLDGRWDKHDTKDSANVADLISQGKCLYYEHPEMKLRELRSLLSLRRRLKRQEHGLKVRIRNHLIAQYFPEFDQYFGQSGSEGLAIVRWCLDPSVISGLPYEEFVRLVAPGKRFIRQQERLREIWQRASASIGCEVGEAVRFESKVMVDGLRQIRQSIGEIDEQITALCVGFPEYKYLLSIPGFGPDVSSKVLGAIGNPFRFSRGTQVLKMAGLDLVAARSGKSSDVAVPVISKNGKADLRYALYQAAMISSIRNHDFIMWFTNKLRGRQREKGIKVKVRVKLSAKLLIIAWTVMKKKEPFNPDYLRIE